MEESNQESHWRHFGFSKGRQIHRDAVESARSLAGVFQFVALVKWACGWRKDSRILFAG